DWSSDVCSSDLGGGARAWAGGRPGGKEEGREARASRRAARALAAGRGCPAEGRGHAACGSRSFPVGGRDAPDVKMLNENLYQTQSQHRSAQRAGASCPPDKPDTPEKPDKPDKPDKLEGRGSGRRQAVRPGTGLLAVVAHPDPAVLGPDRELRHRLIGRRAQGAAVADVEAGAMQHALHARLAGLETAGRQFEV